MNNSSQYIKQFRSNELFFEKYNTLKLTPGEMETMNVYT